MRVLGHICRVVSFAVKTRVMGHFVDLNCARRAYCVVVNEKRAVCTVSAKHLKEAVSWWQTRDRKCLLCQCNWCKAAKSGHYIIGPAARPRVGQIQASPKISQLEEEQLEESLLARLRRSWQAGVSSHIPIALQLMLVRPALAWPDRAPAYI